MVPVFKNIGERSSAKNYRTVSLLSVVSEVFEKLVNNSIVDHREKCGLFSGFQYGFRSSWSTPDLLTVIDVFEWFWMESLHKNIQFMLGILKAPFLILHFSCYTLITFFMMLQSDLLKLPPL